MAVSYKKLFHLLIEKNMTNAQLQQEAGFSANIITRLKRNGYVSLESIEDVYKRQAGDCVMVTNRITGKPQWSPMGSSANMEGRTLAQILSGKEKTYPGVLGTRCV